MTHMHIPDGVLPVWLWVSGFIALALIMGLCLYRLKDADRKKQIPLLGALSAVMLVAMSLEIVPLAYHINLTVVTGILLGPALGFVSAFIVNFMLALIGHGGITVLGLNTMLLGAEAILGHVFFSSLGNKFPLFWRAAAATVLTLLITTCLLVGIVAVSNANPSAFTEAHGHEAGAHEGPVSVGRFAALALGFGALGWIVEAAITGAVVRFIAQVKPDLLRHVLHDDRRREKGRETS